MSSAHKEKAESCYSGFTLFLHFACAILRVISPIQLDTTISKQRCIPEKKSWQAGGERIHRRGEERTPSRRATRGKLLPAARCPGSLFLLGPAALPLSLARSLSWCACRAEPRRSRERTRRRGGASFYSCLTATKRGQKLLLYERVRASPFFLSPVCCSARAWLCRESAGLGCAQELVDWPRTSSQATRGVHMACRLGTRGRAFARRVEDSKLTVGMSQLGYTYLYEFWWSV